MFSESVLVKKSITVLMQATSADRRRRARVWPRRPPLPGVGDTFLRPKNVQSREAPPRVVSDAPVPVPPVPQDSAGCRPTAAAQLQAAAVQVGGRAGRGLGGTGLPSRRPRPADGNHQPFLALVSGHRREWRQQTNTLNLAVWRRVAWAWVWA